LAHFGNAAIAELSPVSGIRRKLDFEPAEGSFWRIVLKKSFFADDWKFSGPLVRLSRGELRDHINYRKMIAGSRIDST